MISEEVVEAVAAKAFQKKEGIKWGMTTEHTRNKWRERCRHQMEAMAKARSKEGQPAQEPGVSDMADVLVEHQRQNSSSCLCGWAELGKSHSEHQAAALSAAGFGPLADAWDEGMAYVFEGGAEVSDENPYRSRA